MPVSDRFSKRMPQKEECRTTETSFEKEIGGTKRKVILYHSRHFFNYAFSNLLLKQT